MITILFFESDERRDMWARNPGVNWRTWLYTTPYLYSSCLILLISLSPSSSPPRIPTCSHVYSPAHPPSSRGVVAAYDVLSHQTRRVAIDTEFVWAYQRSWRAHSSPYSAMRPIFVPSNIRALEVRTLVRLHPRIPVPTTLFS